MLCLSLGWLMPQTFLMLIPRPPLILYEPILNETDLTLVRGRWCVQLGALPRIFQIIAQIGDGAAAMFSILRRYSEILALGYVASRIMSWRAHCRLAISLRTILTLRDDFAGSADPATLAVAGAHARCCPRLEICRGRGFAWASMASCWAGWTAPLALCLGGLALLGVIGVLSLRVGDRGAPFAGVDEQDPACT